MDQREFITTVLGDMRGNAILGLRDRPGPKGKVNRYFDFKYPEQIEEMVAFAAEHSNEDLYISPLVYGEERNTDKDSPSYGKVRRTPENALTSNTVYQDSDTCPWDKFRLKPTIHVTTSAGRYQDFWVLSQPIPAGEAAEISHKIATAHKGDGSDPSSWSANKVLRIPFSVNTSHGFPEDVLVEVSGMVYDSLDIGGAYDDIELVSRPIVRLPADVSYDSDMDLPDYADALNKLPGNFNMELLTKPASDNADRSRMRYLMLCELFRAGTLSFEDALSLAWHAPVSRKWKEDSRNIRGLVAEALKAQSEVSYETGRGLSSPSTDLTEDQIAWFEERRKSELPKVELLTEEERDLIDGEETFITRFCQWAESRQGIYYNAPYARSAAWQFLSSAFVDTAFIARGNGPEYCNLFSMSIGDSGTGKTSMRKLWSTAMHELYPEDPQWNLGSNASPNALHEKLLERDGKFSCFNADEAHGWFKQVNGQQWSDGIYENIAGYYDGEVPPILRTGNRDISGKSGKSYFNMFMMGTLKGDLSLSNVLDRSMFLSGLLARFIWFIGDSKDMTEESMEEVESSAEYVRLGYEPVVRQWVAEFNEAKKRLRTEHKRKMIPIGMDRPALDRLSRAKWEIVRANRQNPNWEILEPSLRNRFGSNIRKAATLLAVEEGKDVIGLKHVLLAIEAAEEWLSSVLLMVEKISDSEWKRLVDEVHDFIASKSRVSLEAVHRRFSSRRSRDLSEHIDALKAQGRVFEKMESGKKWLMTNE